MFGTKGLEPPIPVAWTRCLALITLSPHGVRTKTVHVPLAGLKELPSTEDELSMFKWNAAA